MVTEGQTLDRLDDLACRKFMRRGVPVHTDCGTVIHDEGYDLILVIPERGQHSHILHSQFGFVVPKLVLHGGPIPEPRRLGKGFSSTVKQTSEG